MSFRAVNQLTRRISSTIPRRVAINPRLAYGPTFSAYRPFQASLSGQSRWASSVDSPSLATVVSDPAHAEATALLESGTKLLEEGDIQGALAKYQRSVEINRTASGLFNLGVTHYHLKQFDKAIEVWNLANEMDPASADVHTNLASAYIMAPPSRPQLALQHLQIAASLAPEDGEIAFNLGAVLEACGHLEPALVQYKRSVERGIDWAEVNVRNCSAKIFGQRLKAAAESKEPKDEA